MGTIGIILLASAVILHETLHGDQHSDSLISVLITVMGSVILIFSHIEIESYVHNMITNVTNSYS